MHKTLYTTRLAIHQGVWWAIVYLRKLKYAEVTRAYLICGVIFAYFSCCIFQKCMVKLTLKCFHMSLAKRRRSVRVGHPEHGGNAAGPAIIRKNPAGGPSLNLQYFRAPWVDGFLVHQYTAHICADKRRKYGLYALWILEEGLQLASVVCFQADSVNTISPLTLLTEPDSFNIILGVIWKMRDVI